MNLPNKFFQARNQTSSCYSYFNMPPMTVYPFYFWFTPATPPPVVASTQQYIHHKSPANIVY